MVFGFFVSFFLVFYFFEISKFLILIILYTLFFVLYFHLDFFWKKAIIYFFSRYFLKSVDIFDYFFLYEKWLTINLLLILKQKLKKKARKKYQSLLREKKEYAHERCRNLSESEKKKLVEYRKNYCKILKNTSWQFQYIWTN